MRESEDSEEFESEFSYEENSSESEPEIECDLWDDDCKVIRKLNSSNILGCKIQFNLLFVTIIYAN